MGLLFVYRVSDALCIEDFVVVRKRKIHCVSKGQKEIWKIQKFINMISRLQGPNYRLTRRGKVLNAQQALGNLLLAIVPSFLKELNDALWLLHEDDHSVFTFEPSHKWPNGISKLFKSLMRALLDLPHCALRSLESIEEVKRL